MVTISSPTVKIKSYDWLLEAAYCMTAFNGAFRLKERKNTSSAPPPVVHMSKCHSECSLQLSGNVEPSQAWRGLIMHTLQPQINVAQCFFCLCWLLCVFLEHNFSIVRLVTVYALYYVHVYVCMALMCKTFEPNLMPDLINSALLILVVAACVSICYHAATRKRLLYTCFIPYSSIVQPDLSIIVVPTNLQTHRHRPS